MAEVGSGQIAIFPTFRGFRTAVSKETDGAAKESARGFRALWSKEGSATGKTTGQGFKKAFEGESTGFAAKSTKELERAVASASRTLSQARLKQLDQVGRVRVAEAQLAEAQEKHAVGSSQVLRAMERLGSETRKLEAANESTTRATSDLRDAQTRLGAAADRAGEQLGESGRTGARRFSSGFSEIFKGSFLGTTVAGLASSLVSNIGQAIGTGLRNAIDFAVGSVNIASDLNESVNAVGVAYGEIADQILALGQNSARTFGLSKRELNQYAVQFSAAARTIAGEGGDVAGTFRTILGRATDFASVMNLEVADALGLFQSGLAGETEPLRRFGIDLSAASVEAFAYANGIGQAGVKLSEAQKQQARYALLLEQTNRVQGDFANTSDELANKNRINAATWDDLQAKIGTGFLPIASSLATILSDQVFPALEEMITEHGPGLQAAFEASLPALQQLAVDVLPLLPGLFESIGSTLPAVISAVNTLAPAVLWLTQAYGGWFTAAEGLFSLLSGDTSVDQFRVRLTTIPGPIGDIMRAADELGTRIGLAMYTAVVNVQRFGAGVQSTVNSVIGWFQALPGQITSFFSGAGDWLYNSGKSLIRGFIDGINSMFRSVGDAVGGIVDWAMGFFPNSPAKRGPLSGAGWTRLKQSGSAVMEQWESGFGRPDLTGALTPSYSYAPAPQTARVAGGGYGAPRELVIVDADRKLIGRMRVEAGGVVQASVRADDAKWRGGGKSL